MSMIKSLGYMLMDNDELKFAPAAKSQSLSPSERWLVTLSAPLSAFQGSWVDAIETGLDEATLRRSVADMWGVASRAEFLETANWLVTEGHRGSYEAIWRLFGTIDQAKASLPKWQRILIELTYPGYYMSKVHGTHDVAAIAESAGKDTAYILRLLFESDGMLDSLRQRFSVSPRQVSSLAAWDAVRLASLSRLAVQLGYIRREEFVQIGSGLNDLVKASYTGWNQLSGAYIAAGCIWDSNESRWDNLVRTNRLLLDDRNSPYARVPW